MDASNNSCVFTQKIYTKDTAMLQEIIFNLIGEPRMTQNRSKDSRRDTTPPMVGRHFS